MPRRKRRAPVEPEQLQTAHFALWRRIEALYLAGVVSSPLVGLSASKVAALRQRAEAAMRDSAELETRCGPEALLAAYEYWEELLEIDAGAPDIFDRLIALSKQHREALSGRNVIPSKISDVIGDEITA